MRTNVVPRFGPPFLQGRLPQLLRLHTPAQRGSPLLHGPPIAAHPRTTISARESMPIQLATIAVFSSVVLTLTVAPAAAQNVNVAGRIKVASGSAYVIRGGAELAAAIGQVIYETDSVRTGENGLLGLTLKDDTRVSLGPSSELRIDSFRFAPADSRLGMVLTFVRGVAGYVSGRIAKLAPDAVRLETPAAIIGVRGTTLAVRVAP